MLPLDFPGLLNAKESIIGGISGCIAKSCVAPLSRLSVLMQLQSMPALRKQCMVIEIRRPGAMSLALRILQDEGPKGFWKGNVVSCYHRFFFSSAMFSATASMRRQLKIHKEDRNFVFKTMSASCGGALVAAVVTHPLDVVKTRAMSSGLLLDSNAGKPASMGFRIPAALRTIFHREGFGGLYRGFVVSLCCHVPTVATNFTFYEVLRRYDAPVPLAGATAGAGASALLYPIDLVRRQMHMVGILGSEKVYHSIFEACAHINATGVSRFGPLFGVVAFYRGLTVEMIKVAPGSAVMFSLNEWMNAPRPH